MVPHPDGILLFRFIKTKNTKTTTHEKYPK